MTDSLQSPEKEGYLLVTFSYGDAAATQARYTNWQQAVLNFDPTPDMEVDIPDNTGTFSDQQARFLMPVDAFTSRLADGVPHSPVYVQVVEVVLGLSPGIAGSEKTLYRGKLDESVRNWQGRSDTVALFFNNVKQRLDVPMGLQCNHTCEWRLFSRGCALTQSDFEETGQIAVIDDKEVTISAKPAIEAPFAPGGTNDRFWERGYLEKDGLRIDIHIWDKNIDPKVFVLRSRPPDDWLLAGAASILFVPGCHGTIDDCRNVWDNEQGQGGEGGFMGIGYTMPAHNPIIEAPGSLSL